MFISWSPKTLTYSIVKCTPLPMHLLCIKYERLKIQLNSSLICCEYTSKIFCIWKNSNILKRRKQYFEWKKCQGNKWMRILKYHHFKHLFKNIEKEKTYLCRLLVVYFICHICSFALWKIDQILCPLGINLCQLISDGWILQAFFIAMSILTSPAWVTPQLGVHFIRVSGFHINIIIFLFHLH